MAGYRRTKTASLNGEAYEDIHERAVAYGDSIRNIAGGVDRQLTDYELFIMSSHDSNFGLGLDVREAIAEAFCCM